MSQNNTKLKARFQQKTDSTANWEKATNFIPEKGELIVYQDEDVSKIKVGDGKKTVGELRFSVGESGGGSIDLPLSNGEGTKTLVFNDGVAKGSYSFAGGSTDKQLVTDIVGDLIDDYIAIEPSQANAGMSIAYGAGNIAHSSASNAFGIKNQAGFLGYYIREISNGGKTLKLSAKQNSNVTPNSAILSKWGRNSKGEKEDGWFVCINNGDVYPLCAEIDEVNSTNGTVTFKQALPFSTIVNADTSDLPYSRSIVVIPPVGTQFIGIDIPFVGPVGTNVETYRPTALGEVELGFSSTAFGFDNITAGALSVAFGMRNNTHGVTSAAFGRENTAGNFASFVTGYLNKALGNSSFAAGQKNTVSGKQSAAFGISNKAIAGFAFVAGNNAVAQANCSQAFGIGTKTAAQFDTTGAEITGSPGFGQMAIGKYNKFEDDLSKKALFIIGSGSSNSDRQNAFLVTKDKSLSLGQAGAIPGTHAASFGSYNGAVGERTLAGGTTGTNHKGNFAYGTGAIAWGHNTIAYSRYSKSLGMNTQTGLPLNEEESRNRKIPVLKTTKLTEENTTATASEFSTVEYDSSTQTWNLTLIGKEIKDESGSVVEGESGTIVFTYQVPEDAKLARELVLTKPYSDTISIRVDGKLISTSEEDEVRVDLLALGSKTTIQVEISGGHPFASASDEFQLSEFSIIEEKEEVKYEQSSDRNTGQNSIAFGLNTTAIANNAVAGGYGAVASGAGSFAFGTGVRASGGRSIALGDNNDLDPGTAGEIVTEAAGYGSIAIGSSVRAYGRKSIAIGTGTIAGAADQIVIGQYNKRKDTASFIIGSGTYSKDDGVLRANVLEVIDGAIHLYGEINASNSTIKTKDLKVGSTTELAILKVSSTAELTSLKVSSTAQLANLTVSGTTSTATTKVKKLLSTHKNASIAPDYGLAMGDGASVNSSAIGMAFGASCTTTGGNNNLALGYGCTSWATSQVIVGRYNAIGTGTSGTSENSTMFAVGIGSSTKRITGLSCHFSGKTQINGNLHINSFTSTADAKTEKQGYLFVEGGIILTSPNGTKFKITVNDDGTLNSTQFE